jgi:GMP synthase-like glutamine amidotransferase
LNIFVVNNGSQYLENIILKISKDNKYTIYNYKPGYKINVPKETDLIILSGGMVQEVVDEIDGQHYYKEEFDLIKAATVPIFGICLGLQMMAYAMGGSLKQLPNLQHKNIPIKLNHVGHTILGHGDLFVHERHAWVVDELDGTGFSVLAESEDGVEIIHHNHKNLFATQFHPEIDVDHNSNENFWRLINSFLEKANNRLAA